MVDFRRFPHPPKSLKERIEMALDMFPEVNVLFIHRDAETKTIEERKGEVEKACVGVASPFICVVPIRMLEAWFLMWKEELREAAGNPKGKEAFKLPAVKSIEKISDPKEHLYDLLKTASGLSKRRLKKFKPNKGLHFLSDLIRDYSPLRQLSAFKIFEEDVKERLNPLNCKELPLPVLILPRPSGGPRKEGL